MSKPDDIPESVWDTATAQPLGSTGDIDDDISEAVARAILAERERCAKIALEYGDCNYACNSAISLAIRGDAS